MERRFVGLREQVAEEKEFTNVWQDIDTTPDLAGDLCPDSLHRMHARSLLHSLTKTVALE
jgi:hypothetical protein